MTETEYAPPFFLKGCPLRCVWCQNPEGIDPKAYPVHFPNKCIRCGACLEMSKNGGVHFDNGEIRLCREKADEWPEIIKECPTGGIVMDSVIYTAEQLAEEVLKDEVFFRRGGRGYIIRRGASAAGRICR